MEKVQVALRVRPLNSREHANHEESIWTIANNSTISAKSLSLKDTQSRKSLGMVTGDLSRCSFTYDYCFQPKHDNQSVYQTVAKSVILSSLSGYNGTIFMYGQTGSGKTYTMMGYTGKSEEELRSVSAYSSLLASPQSLYSNTGILIQSLKDIFQAIQNDTDKTFFLKCSYVEIYNDQIYDLLANTENLADVLSLGEDPAKKEFYVRGVIQESVSSIEEILEKLQRGELNRHYASTTMNHSSSRSHTIFRLHVQAVTNAFIRKYRKKQQAMGMANINNADLEGFRDGADAPPPEMDMTMDSQLDVGIGGGSGTMVTESYLNFVDLAGSEKVSNHQGFAGESGMASTLNSSSSHLARSSSRERVNEGKHINKSLFFLTQVISLMSEGKMGVHIPFRNSPLTKILRSSLGGNSRTLIILCVTPAGSQYEQTMSTLRFGANAKKIENKVSANIVTNDDSEAVRIMISDYEERLRHAEAQRKDDKVLISKFKGIIRQLTAEKQLLMKKLSAAKAASRNGLMQETLKKELHSIMGSPGSIFSGFGVSSGSLAAKGTFECSSGAGSSLGQMGLSKKDYLKGFVMSGNKSGLIFSSEKTFSNMKPAQGCSSMIDLAQNESAKPQLRLLHEQLHQSKEEATQIKEKHEEYLEHFKVSFAKLIEWVIFYRENLEEVAKHCSQLQKTVEEKVKETETAQKEASKDNSRLRQFTDDGYIQLMSDSELHELEIRSLKLVDMAKMELVVRTVKQQFGMKDIGQINHGKFISMKHGLPKINSSSQTEEMAEGSTTERTKKKKKRTTTTLVNPKIAEILQKVSTKEKEFADFLQSSQCDFSKMTLENHKFKFNFEGIDAKWRELEKSREKRFDEIIKKYTAQIQEQLVAFESKISEVTKATAAEADAGQSLEALENELKRDAMKQLGIEQKDYLDSALENIESSRVLNQSDDNSSQKEEAKPDEHFSKKDFSRSSSGMLDKGLNLGEIPSLFEKKKNQNEEMEIRNKVLLGDDDIMRTPLARTNHRISGGESKKENYNSAFSPELNEFEGSSARNFNSLQGTTSLSNREANPDPLDDYFAKKTMKAKENSTEKPKKRKDSMDEGEAKKKRKKKKKAEEEKVEEADRVSLTSNKNTVSSSMANFLPPSGTASAKKPPQAGTPRLSKGANYGPGAIEELEKSTDGARRNLDVNELLSGLSQTPKAPSSNSYLHVRKKSQDITQSSSSLKQSPSTGNVARPLERSSSKNQKPSRSRSRGNSVSKKSGQASHNSSSISNASSKQVEATGQKFMEEHEMARRMLEDQGQKIGGKSSKKVVSMKVYEINQPEAYECAGSDLDEEESNKIFAKFAQKKLQETDLINGMRSSNKSKPQESKSSSSFKQFSPSSMENLDMKTQGSFNQPPGTSQRAPSSPFVSHEESSFESGSVMSSSQEPGAKKARKSKEERKKNK